MKNRLIFLIPMFFFCQFLSAQSDSLKRRNKGEYEKGEAMQSWNFGGIEIIAPRNLKHGYFVKNQFLTGPTLDLYGGLFKLSVLSGYYTNTDSIPGKEINVKSNRFGATFNYPFPIIPSKKVNIVPHLGLGIFSQTGSHPFMETKGDGGVFGFNVNSGISLIFGPIKASASYYLEAGYAENASINRVFHGFPSFSIALSPQVFLFNPQVFSHTGIKRWRENYISYTTTKDEYSSPGYIKRTTTTHTSWSEMSAVRSAEIKDVRPFFFIGPRLQTGFSRMNQSAIIPTYGFNMGFRAGTFYVNGFLDKGKFYFREPFKRDEASGKSNVLEAKTPRLDGYLTGGSRIGAEIGLDLVTYFIKEGFDEKSAFYNKTSFYGIILKFGYSQQKFNGIQFFSDSGSTYLSNWMNINIVPGNQLGYNFRGDIRTAPNKINNYNFGIVASIGAFVINYDYFMNESLKVLSHSEVSICYHYPIIRLVKAINVYTKTHGKNQ